MPLAHKGITPRLHPSVFVAEGARIVGDVEIWEDSSAWFNAMVRGDEFLQGRGDQLRSHPFVRAAHRVSPCVFMRLCAAS